MNVAFKRLKPISIVILALSLLACNSDSDDPLPADVLGIGDVLGTGGENAGEGQP